MASCDPNQSSNNDLSNTSHDLISHVSSENDNDKPQTVTKNANNKIDSDPNDDIPYQSQKIIFNNTDGQNSPSYTNFFERDIKDEKLTSKDDDKIQPPPRWKLLYDKAVETRVAKEHLVKESQIPKEDPECTFKPKLSTGSKKRMKAIQEGCEEDQKSLNMYERNKVWKTKADEKILENRDMAQGKLLNECTFKPQINKIPPQDGSARLLTSQSARGLDQYLRRQIIAKQKKDEKELLLENPLSKLPSRSYKKEGKVTIPVNPTFGKPNGNEIYSTKKPFEYSSIRSPRKKGVEELYGTNDLTARIRESQTLVDPVQIRNMRMNEAIDALHKELNSFRLDYEEDF